VLPATAETVTSPPTRVLAVETHRLDADGRQQAWNAISSKIATPDAPSFARYRLLALHGIGIHMATARVSRCAPITIRDPPRSAARAHVREPVRLAVHRVVERLHDSVALRA
jgi:hypothetical protein